MTLTKAEAIRRHRLLWNWIAQTNIQEQRCVTKKEALAHFGWSTGGCASLCDYAESQIKFNSDNRICHKCPIDWPGGSCVRLVRTRLDERRDLGLYDKYMNSFWIDNYIDAAKYAYKIAELPERKD